MGILVLSRVLSRATNILNQSIYGCAAAGPCAATRIKLLNRSFRKKRAGRITPDAAQGFTSGNERSWIACPLKIEDAAIPAPLPIKYFSNVICLTFGLPGRTYLSS
jgi:hypothetical protein